jgi:UDP-N-acetylmuramyl tripeptide synthase
MSYKVVTITGTKGKTTVSNLIDTILLRLGTGKETLRVDTNGHYINGKQRSTFEDSHRIYGIAPTVCPGRYCMSLKSFDPEKLDNTVAVLESSLGSGGTCGTGIKTCNVGVWTNVLEDHLGSSDRLKSREDIADAKDFVFKQVCAGGYAVFNACDDLVCSKTNLIDKEAKLLPCVFNDDEVYFNIEKHIKAGGEALILRDAKIFKRNADGERLVYDAEDLPWTFEGHFKPSMTNLTLTLGAIYAIHDGHFPRGLNDVIDGIRLDPYGGRLTLLKAKSGTTIIADYAHETESLLQVSNLARRIADKQGGKTIAVIRLPYDRTEKLIKKTGQAISKAYDELIVYDKIDGYYRRPEKRKISAHFTQSVGRVARILGAAISKKNKNTKIIIREDKALDFAAKEATENDVVVAIVNDDIHRSIDWIREKFAAKFVK